MSTTGALALANSGQDSIVYVSLTAGSIPGGATATIQRLGDDRRAITSVIDGGFVPVAVPASLNDSIEILIRDGQGAMLERQLISVAASRAPVVVRTYPPPRKRDHALNAAIVVVFSEPMSAASITPTAVRLLRGTSTVAGTVRFLDATLDATQASLQFVPDVPLAPQAHYQLLVTSEVRDLSNDRLAAPDTVAFSTGASSTGPLASIHTSPDSQLFLRTGDTYQLTAVVRDSMGNVVTDQPVTWSGGNPDIVTVSATGLVTALADGGGTVLASIGDVKKYVFILIAPQPAASITITPNPATVAAYDTTQLVATLRDSAGRVVNNPYPYLEWTSSAPAVATVNAATQTAGRVTGLAPGTVTITAKQGAVHGSAGVTVTPNPVTVTVRPDSATIVVSGYAMVFDTLRHSDGQIVSGFPVSWRSDNPGVATVDTNGLVKGIRFGSARIIATRDVSTDTALITVGTINLMSVSGTCAVSAARAAYCWGTNSGNELGMGSNQGPLIEAPFDSTACGVYATWWSCSLTPVLVAGGLEVSYVGGGAIRCALTTGGAAYCWAHFQLNDSGFGVPLPVEVSGGHNFASMSAGNVHVCALTSTGAAYCWGYNYQGELGDGTTTSNLVPVAVARGLAFVSVSAGDGFTCGLGVSGTAYCWGRNEVGQLGDGSITEHHAPVAVGGGLTFASVSAAGADHACGITTSGAAYCWGSNYWGQLGDSSTIERHIPVAVAGGLSFASISAGRFQTCGVTTGGIAYCWGNNGGGQLGDGSITDRHAPAPVSGGLTFSSVSSGSSSSSCGVTTGSVAYCWGGNFSGSLGNGTLTNSPVPVKVAGQP